MLEDLCNSIKSHESALVALSGGVDSSVVAAIAKRALGDNAVAVTVDNGLLGIGDLERASNVAADVGIRHLLIDASPLSLPEVKRNDPERCYHCKKLIFKRLKSLAEELRLRVVMDGTNASDLKEYRPGIKALQEFGTVSPLERLTKKEIRELARELGLQVANTPSSACLLTRFPYHTDITHEMLERVRKAEAIFKSFSFAQVRVRDHGGIARIEVEKEDYARVLEQAESLSEILQTLGFTYVTLDLQGFQSGSMDRGKHR